eukprot:125859-Rhodomonas_salina.1
MPRKVGGTNWHGQVDPRWNFRPAPELVLPKERTARSTALEKFQDFFAIFMAIIDEIGPDCCVPSRNSCCLGFKRLIGPSSGAPPSYSSIGQAYWAPPAKRNVPGVGTNTPGYTCRNSYPGTPVDSFPIAFAMGIPTGIPWYLGTRPEYSSPDFHCHCTRQSAIGAA